MNVGRSVGLVNINNERFVFFKKQFSVCLRERDGRSNPEPEPNRRTSMDWEKEIGKKKPASLISLVVVVVVVVLVV
jgi:hypothetical protein